MVRTYALVPEALLAVGAIAALGSRRPSFRGWLPVAAPLLVLGALAVELTAGGGLGSLFNGSVAVDRFALYAKSAVLFTLLIVLLAADWDMEEAPGAIPQAFLAALGGLVAASATTIPALWSGVALAAIAAAIGLGTGRPGIDAGAPIRALRARAAGGVVVAAALALVAAAALAFVAAEAGTWTLAGARVSLGVGTAVTLPSAIAAVVALGSLAMVMVLAPLGFGSGFGPAVSPLARGTAAGLGALGAGIGLVKMTATLTPLWPGWSPALLVAGAGCAFLGGLLALSAAGTRRRLAALAASQLGWVVMGAATHDRAGLTATLLTLGAAALALAAAPVLLAELEARSPGPAGGPAGRGATGEQVGLTGLGRRHPGRGAGLLLAAGSLAAVPPLGGFLGDFTVAAALAGTGQLWPVAVGVTGSLLGAFAVLRLAHAIFLEEELEESAAAALPARTGRGARGAGRLELSPRTLGPVLVTVLLAAFTIFANPISGLAFQGAEALGIIR